MQIFDTRQTYLDSEGKPCRNGRLSFFLYNTVTPTTVYAFPNYTGAVGETERLSASGWSDSVLYSPVSLTVHLEKYIGVNQYGQDVFQFVKSFDILSTESGGSNGSNIVYVDTIAELKAIVPTEGMIVEVGGYYTRGDCPSRLFQYETTSIAAENLGTVFESSQTPTGRWIYNPEVVLASYFGVLQADNLQVNAGLTNASAYCNTVKRPLVITPGNYMLTGGSNITLFADLKTESGVYFHSAGATSIVTLFGLNLDITDTFAGGGVSLVITNGANSTIPSVAFGSTTDLTGSTGSFGLRLTRDETFEFYSLKTFRELDLGSSVFTLEFLGTASKSLIVNKITGNGQMVLTNPNCGITIKDTLRSSNISVSQVNDTRAMVKLTADLYIIDRPYDAYDPAYTTGYEGIAVNHRQVNICSTFKTNHIFFFKNITCQGGTIQSPIRYNNDSAVDVQWFSPVANLLVSYAYSPEVSKVDLGKRNMGYNDCVKKDLNGNYMDVEIHNGLNIRRIEATGKTVRVYNTVIVSDLSGETQYVIDAANIIAQDCTLSRLPNTILLPHTAKKMLTNCTLKQLGGGVSPTTIRLYNDDQLVRCVQDGLINVEIVPTTAGINNIKVADCVFNRFNFRASVGTSIDANVRNVRVTGCTLNNDFEVSNGPTYRWNPVSSQHRNIVIKDNNLSSGTVCVSTEGLGRFTATQESGSNYNIANVPVFSLNGIYTIPGVSGNLQELEGCQVTSYHFPTVLPTIGFGVTLVTMIPRFDGSTLYKWATAVASGARKMPMTVFFGNDAISGTPGSFNCDVCWKVYK